MSTDPRRVDLPHGRIVATLIGTASGLSAIDSAYAGKTASEDDQIVQLRHQLGEEEHERAWLNEQLSQLKDELTKHSSDLNESREQHPELSRELAQAMTLASISVAGSRRISSGEVFEVVLVRV